MNAEGLRREVVAALATIAPDADAGAVAPERAFRDQIELDSVDFLNFVLALERRLGVRIPQADYPKLSTLAGAVAYLASHGGEVGG